MFVVELRFTEHQDRLSARPAHRERLQELHAAGTLMAAGPWRDDSGALLLFEVGCERELRDLMAADPYYTVPGVTVLSVRHWTPVVGPAGRT